MKTSVRVFDWSQTALGAQSTWTPGFHALAATCLHSQFPAFLCGGPNHTVIFNDAFVITLGIKDARPLLGLPLRDAAPEIWNEIGSDVERLCQAGGTALKENVLVFLPHGERSQERYLSFSFSAFHDESNAVVAILCLIQNHTEQLISERRLRTLTKLVHLSSNLNSRTDACRAAAEILAQNPEDLSFASLYLCDPASESAHLCGSAAIPAGTPVSPEFVRLDQPGDGLHPTGEPLTLSSAFLEKHTQLLSTGSFESISQGVWNLDPDATIMLPLSWPGHSSYFGFLIAGIGSRTHLDDAYRHFLNLVATLLRDTFAAALSREQNARDLESNERQWRIFRTALANTPDFTYTFDRNGHFTYANRALLNLLQKSFDDVQGKNFFQLEYPHQLATRLHRQIQQVVDTKAPVRDETPFTALSGETRHYEYIFVPVLSHQNEVEAVAGSTRDITDRKRAEQTQLLLIGELNHRVKNTLATVQSIANNTLEQAASPAEFVANFNNRLQALARAHSVLSRGSWEGASLTEILDIQLILEEASERVSYSGPPVFLSAASALQLSLVLHELGTNAHKHGALSVPGGRLSLAWSIISNGSSQLRMDWIEQKGPLVTTPRKIGFGTLLIGQSLRGIGGKTTSQFEPSGFTCRIHLPLASHDIN